MTEHVTSPPTDTKRRGTSGMAVVSLVLAILWGWGIGSAVAIIFGLVALRDIRRSNGWETGAGLAYAGIVLGVVGVVGVAIYGTTR